MGGEHIKSTLQICLFSLLCAFCFSGNVARATSNVLPLESLLSPQTQQNFCRSYLPIFTKGISFNKIFIRNIIGVTTSYEEEGETLFGLNVFLVIQNRSSFKEDTLLKVETLMPSEISLLSREGDKETRHKMEDIKFPIHATMALRNKNAYLQIRNLEYPVPHHSSFPLSFTFEEGGKAVIPVPVLDQEEFAYTMEAIALKRCRSPSSAPLQSRL